MLLWIIFAAMTAAAVIFILWPLSRSRAAALETRETADLDVYRDQLARLDYDVERGVLGVAEAQAARTEISRRLLKASERRPSAPAGQGLTRNATLAGGAAVLAVVGISLGTYVFLGTPGLPGQPFAERANQSFENMALPDLLAQAESQLKDSPDDVQGWAAVAPIYLRIGRFEDAARAFSNIVRLTGGNAVSFAALGESIVLANEGFVTNPARQALNRANQLDPTMVRPRFYLALAYEQEGDFAAAASSWQALLADAAPDAPWREAVVQRLSLAQMRLEGGAPGSQASETGSDVGASPEPADGGATASAPAAQPGPSRADVEAAQEMTDEQRRQMVDEMVGRLAERLEAEGGDIDSWLRLARAYGVLGRVDDAADALEKAALAFQDTPQAMSQITEMRRSLGLAQ
jgi:cytochrome c-type biogenesis protein CcmH